MSSSEPLRQDLQAALGARRELGPEYEAAIVESFVDNLERTIAARVDEHLAEVDVKAAAAAGDTRQFVLGIVSLGTGIPITAISGAMADLLGMVFAWGGIVAVNYAYAWSRRR